jgi:hypothetical protein
MHSVPPPISASTAARLALLAALALFLARGAYQLALPGLHYDEAKEAGVNAMQIVTGAPVTAFRDAAVRIGPVVLPLMVQDYIGSSNVALAIRFLALGGVNVTALRWMPLLLGALTVLVVWKLAGELGGPAAAGIAALLLAVNPSFLFWSRQGVLVTNLTAVIFMAMLLFAARWQRNGRTADLYLAAFLAGWGIYAKLLFVWALGGVVVLAVVVWLLNRGIAPRPSRRAVLIAGACFLLPLVPLVAFNLRTNGTLSAVFDNLGRSYYGVDNTAFLANLRTRIEQLGALLRGDHFWYLGEEFGNPWAPWLGGALVLAVLVGTRGADRRRALAPAVLLLLAVMQSAFTVSDLFITHYALLVPLIPLSAGLAAAALFRARAQRAWGRILAAGALAAVIWWGVADLWTVARYHAVLHDSGGYAAHSDAIYALADYLNQYEPAAPLALDWGLDAPLRFLTAGRVNPLEVFGYDDLATPDIGFAGRVGPFLDDPRSLYLAHAPDATVFRDRVDTLAGLAEARGLMLVEDRRFNERNGTPLFIVYRTTPVE